MSFANNDYTYIKSSPKKTLGVTFNIEKKMNKDEKLTFT